ncbi:hypothetical protein Pmani_037082 [Petrolisthes manimaculis]|uniref:Uncharacterized protein n=1 Tax=Petrolisthes manimaculis TaxID=1843537 RepID=A0AAE1NJW6_9EUCA|nr:hypothetical protein Pmani_037082 [Petrolisthes manimaculis]
MKTIGPRKILTLDSSNCTIISPQAASAAAATKQTITAKSSGVVSRGGGNTASTNSVGGVGGVAFGIAALSPSPSQKTIHNVGEKKIKVIKKITTSAKEKIIKSAHSSVLGLPTNTQQQQQQLKKENVALGKQTLGRKNRKQVLKPNDNEGSGGVGGGGERFIISDARSNCPTNLNIMKPNRKRGRKPKSELLKIQQQQQQQQQEQVVRVGVAGGEGVVRGGVVRVGGGGGVVRVRGVRGGGMSGGNANRTLSHRTYRRRRRECQDSENYTPKTRRRQRQTNGGGGGGGKPMRRHWRKKKRGPGRPRKVDLEEYESTDLSDLDSLFDEEEEAENVDLENKPIVLVKQKRDAAETETTIAENIPTVELDLFTLPSLNEQQLSVLLTEPQNPNFKVYASMDAIFVGDSALGDVTNQIGYVTDANNVVFVNPSHFLFPNVEDLENFVPSPILTMKGNNNNNNNNGKSIHTPVRQVWKLAGNKSSPKKDAIITKTPHIGIKSPQRRPAAKCDPIVARLNTHQLNESQTTTTTTTPLSKTTTTTTTTAIPKLRENVSSVARKESHPTKHLSGIVGVVGGNTENTTVTNTSTNSQHSVVKRLRRRSRCITDIDKQQQQQIEQQQQQVEQQQQQQIEQQQQTVGESAVKIRDENDDEFSKCEIAKSDSDTKSVSEPSVANSSAAEPSVASSNAADPSVAKSDATEHSVANSNATEPSVANSSATEPSVANGVEGRTVNEILGIVSPRKGRPRKGAPQTPAPAPPSPSKKTLIVTTTIISEQPKIDDVVTKSEKEKEGKLKKKEINEKEKDRGRKLKKEVFETVRTPSQDPVEVGVAVDHKAMV